MSYYGYPNPSAYGANYQQAAYAAYDQYQAAAAAAYNAAAYRTMQQQQQPPLPPGQPPASSGGSGQSSASGYQHQQKNGGAGCASISQPAQRYDYSQNMNKTASSSNFYASAYGSSSSSSSNMMQHQHQQMQQSHQPQLQQHQANPSIKRWPAAPSVGGNMGVGIGGGGIGGGSSGGGSSGYGPPTMQAKFGNNKMGLGFKKPMRTGPPGGGQMQVFYCDACKISCAGPQTYKEHLEGQKHKKREQAQKQTHSEQQQQNSEQQQQPQQQQSDATNGVVGQFNPRAGGYNNNNGGMPPRNPPVVRCELCEVACTGRDAYNAHIRGMKHQKTLKLHQKLGKPIPADLLVATPASAPTQQQQQHSYQSTTNSFPQVSVIHKAAQLATSYPAQPSAAAAAPIATPPVVKQQMAASSGAGPQPVPPPPTPVTTSISSSQQSSTTVDMSSQPQAMSSQMSTAATSAINVSATATLMNESMNEDENENVVESSNPAAAAAAAAAAASLEPIGKEYIETKLDGKILSFYCKLCDCQFNDPNAKDMHTKGRRHRLAYKKKVDPSLVVDMKMSTLRQKTNIQMRMSGIGGVTGGIRKSETASNGDMGDAGGPIKPLMTNGQSAQPQSIHQFMNHQHTNNKFASSFGQQQQQQRYPDSFEDRHIMAKHTAISPSDSEMSAIQEIVTNTEKALKQVSDQLTQEIIPPPTATATDSATEPKPATAASTEALRTLKGVMRVGLLAKNLLLKGDTDVKLIVICSDKPTKKLLERVYELLKEKIETVAPKTKYSIILDREAETILVVTMNISELQPLITCKVLLTSPAVRAGDEQPAVKSEPLVNKDNKDDEFLDKQRCLDSLADLRHAKWFQAKASQVPNCVILLRVLRDLCQRNPTWTPLKQWSLELLVEKSLSSSAQVLSSGEALRRVLECVSSGVLLPDGPGLFDPCEKDPTDAADCLNDQQKEDLTASAQMALRLFAFKQIHKILGMDCLTSHLSQVNKTIKKRQLAPPAENECPEEKKGKIEQASAATDTSAKSEVTATPIETSESTPVSEECVTKQEADDTVNNVA